MARAPARRADRTRMRGRYQRISARYTSSHAAKAAVIRASITDSKISDPTNDASAKAITLMTSTVTSVSARAACISFCAMRPAKSSSKKVTAWPSVHRFRRDKTNGLMFGATRMEFAAEESPKNSGRATRKNAVAAKSIHSVEPSKYAAGSVPETESTTRFRISAVTASIPPATAEKRAASHKTGHAPDNAQRTKGHRVVGGGPSAGRNALIQSPGFIQQPPATGTHPIAATRSQRTGRRAPEGHHGCLLRRYGPDPSQEFDPSEQW